MEEISCESPISLGNSWCSRRIYPVEIYWNRTAALSDCIINLPATHFQTRWLDIVEDEWWLLRLLEGPFGSWPRSGHPVWIQHRQKSCSYIENSPGEYNSSATEVSMAWRKLFKSRWSTIPTSSIAPSHSAGESVRQTCSVLKILLQSNLIKTSEGQFRSHYAKGHSRPEKPS